MKGAPIHGLIDDIKDGAPYVKFKLQGEVDYSGITIYGDGYVGGKSIGLIFLKDVMERKGISISEKYQHMIMIPRSFILRTGFYDEFMNLNSLDDRVRQKCDGWITPEELERDFMNAELPESLEDAMQDILLRAHDLPLVVRSSSLLEDNLHYSFAGIYLSVFISNRGTLSERMDEMAEAVKRVYASVFGEDAKQYRQRKNIDWTDEKMAILVQEVVGREHRNNLYYPIMSGVAFTRNYYPWSKRIKQDEGLVRLVYGLGTKAVGRSYARVFTPFLPGIRPEGLSPVEIVHYSQNEFDALDLKRKRFLSVPLNEAAKYDSNIRLVASIYEDGYLSDIVTRPHDGQRIVLTFDSVMKNQSIFPLVPILQDLVKNVERIAGIPMDLEFAVEVGSESKVQCAPGFYIVQCRPLGVRPEYRWINIPHVPKDQILLESRTILGNGRYSNIRHIVYVSPTVFNFQTSHQIAREVGKVDRLLEQSGYVLIGPGRWGTTHPELGVPVKYSEISNAVMIVEVATADATPELSYGTHFFGDLVSTNILYASIFPERGDYLRTEFLETSESILDTRYVKVIRVNAMEIYANGKTRRAVIAISP